MADAKRTGIRLRKSSKPVAILLLVLLSACTGTFYHRFYPVENALWAKTDTLEYIFSGSQSGNQVYCINADVRVRASYRYKDLLMGVKVVTSDGSQLVSDTLVCNVYDDNGRREGTTAGLLYQLSSNSTLVNPVVADSLVIRLSHVMGCDTLDGVTDVGIRISVSN